MSGDKLLNELESLPENQLYLSPVASVVSSHTSYINTVSPFLASNSLTIPPYQDNFSLSPFTNTHQKPVPVTRADPSSYDPASSYIFRPSTNIETDHSHQLTYPTVNLSTDNERLLSEPDLYQASVKSTDMHVHAPLCQDRTSIRHPLINCGYPLACHLQGDNKESSVIMCVTRNEKVPINSKYTAMSNSEQSIGTTPVMRYDNDRCNNNIDKGISESGMVQQIHANSNALVSDSSICCRQNDNLNNNNNYNALLNSSMEDGSRILRTDMYRPDAKRFSEVIHSLTHAEQSRISTQLDDAVEMNESVFCHEMISEQQQGLRDLDQAVDHGSNSSCATSISCSTGPLKVKISLKKRYDEERNEHDSDVYSEDEINEDEADEDRGAKCKDREDGVINQDSLSNSTGSSSGKMDVLKAVSLGPVCLAQESDSVETVCESGVVLKLEIIETSSSISPDSSRSFRMKLRPCRTARQSADRSEHAANNNTNDKDLAMHRDNLQYFCRLCGERCTISKESNAVPISKVKYKQVIRLVLGCNVLDDQADVHPPYICEMCRRKLDDWRNKKNKNKASDVRIALEVFVRHSDDCLICANMCGEPLASKKALLARICMLLKKYDFAVMTRDKEHVMFGRVGIVGVKHTHSVSVHKDGSWTISLLGTDVTKCTKLENFPQLLNNGNAPLFMDMLSKLIICNGNNDFDDVCRALCAESRALFHSTDKVITAYEEMGYMEKDTVRNVNCELICNTGAIRCTQCAAYREQLLIMRRIVGPAGMADTGKCVKGNTGTDVSGLIKTHSQSSLVNSLVSANNKTKVLDSEDTYTTELFTTLDKVQHEYQCFECDKEFRDTGKLKRHKMIHSGIRPHKCNFCEKGFTEPYKLQRHLMVHTGQKPFTCNVCNKPFREQSKMKAHMMVHTGQYPYHCPNEACSKGFRDVTKLKQHLKVIHKMQDDDIQPFKCTKCEDKFPDYNKLMVHLRAHRGPKPFTCDVCAKTFRLNSQLVVHTRMHTGEKPFLCPQCGKGFAQQSDLKKHIRVHTGERPYHCTVCDKDFSGFNHFQTHKRTHSGEKPYVCDICQRAFASSGNMQSHRRRHTGEMPYQCDVCHKEFRVTSNLKRHMVIHTGHKPHQCELCGKGFTAPYRHKIHMQRHASGRLGSGLPGIPRGPRKPKWSILDIDTEVG